MPDPSPQPLILVRSRLSRLLYLLLAVFSLGLAVLGALLPGLPSTEFVLLAAWAAARSSPRLHAWLLNHRLFGPTLRHWHQGQQLSRRSKWVISASMSVAAGLLLWHLRPWLALSLIACMAAVLFWLWRRPEPNTAAG